MSAQTAADLRSLVARRVGSKRRVVLLGSDPALLKALQANGCEVLTDPGSLDEVTAFSAQVVVAFDGFAREGDGAGNFAALAAAAPEAELIFSFANAASASALLGQLTGQPPPPALSEPQVRGWLAAAGFEIASRDVVVGQHAPTGLAVDAEAQLRQLLEQLNPDAGAERLLLVARRGSPAATPAPEPGLLSVLISTASFDLPLQTTLASLASQLQRPLEVIVATSASAEETERIARGHAERGGFRLEVVACASPDFAARTNAALGRARGQWLAFLEAGDSVERPHFRQLIQSLGQGTSAWAIARVKQPGVAAIEGAFSLQAWLAANATARCGLLLDRTRLGPFPLTFAEGIADAEALFLARLAALFPAVTAGGAPSAERPAVASRFSASALADAMKARPLRAVGPLTLVSEAGWGTRAEKALERRLPGVSAELQRLLKPR